MFTDSPPTINEKANQIKNYLKRSKLLDEIEIILAEAESGDEERVLEARLRADLVLDKLKNYLKKTYLKKFKEPEDKELAKIFLESVREELGPVYDAASRESEEKVLEPDNEKKTKEHIEEAIMQGVREAGDYPDVPVDKFINRDLKRK